MSFEKRGFRELYRSLETDLRRRAPALTDWEEGSVVRSLFESFAYELATLYEQMDLVYQAGFVDTAAGANLDRVVAVLGITRNEPDFATGEVTFERDPGSTAEITIPVGTLVTTRDDPEQTPSKKAYATIEDVRLLPGETTVDAKVQAGERGPEWVADSEAVTVMPRPVPGVKSVKNRRPIRFLGRERESDEDLRDRAKKALLASGRASVTAIESALLGMPGVRGVRVREPYRTVVELEGTEAAAAQAADDDSGLRRGEVEVFVDGLNADNAQRLRDRIDEVRAAGIFVVLEPAVARSVQATLRIEADPRVTGEALAVLERQVRDAVIRFLDKQRMGQPLLFSQLTREVLDVKGVSDLPDFRLTIFREARRSARGTLTLTRPAGSTGELTIPARTEVATAAGQRFLTLEAATLAEDKSSVDVVVEARRRGREGELLRTGSAVEWAPLRVGAVELAVTNAAPLRLERKTYTPEARRVGAELEERFVPDLIRVAAGPKTLVVQVLVRLTLPSDESREALAAAVTTAAKGAAASARPGAQWAKDEKLDADAQKEVEKIIDRFFTRVANTARPAAGFTAVPDEATRAAMEAAVEAYFAEAREGNPPQVKEAEVYDTLAATLRRELTGDRVRVALDPALKAALATARAAAEASFPADEVAEALRDGLERTRRAKVAAEEEKVEKARTALDTAAATLRDASTALAVDTSDPKDPAKVKAVTDAQTAYNQKQTAYDAATRQLAKVTSDAADTLAAETAKVPARVEALRARVLAALDTLAADPSRASILAAAEGKTAFALAVRLRTVGWEGEVRPDAPYVEAAFVETPEAETFVYARVVELAGVLALTLPLTATDEEKRRVRAQVRQAAADYLDGLRPEENVELRRLEELAEAHELVLRAAFEPDAALKDRLQKGTLSVGAMEKVVLSPTAFDIRA